jgi:hypothetical protein
MTRPLRAHLTSRDCRSRTSLRRAGISVLAVVPLVLASGVLGQATAATASTNANHASVRPSVAAAPSNRAPLTPALPPGMRYAPPGSRSAGRGAFSLTANEAPGAGRNSVPAPDRPSAPRPSAAELKRLSSTSKSLKSAKVPYSDTTITSVSCHSSTFCMAVGWTYDYGIDTAYAAKWNGHSWSSTSAAQYTEDGYTDDQDLYGVSCASATSCVAVGYAYEVAYDGEALAETWNGSKWTVHIADVGLYYPTLDSVSCFSPTDCEAVGYADSDGTAALTWDGATWSIDTAPTFSSSDHYLYGVSCASSTDCIAVGAVENEALILSYNGGAWTQVAADDPGSGNYLYGVSCPTTSTCIAVGYQETFAQEIGLIEKISVSGGVAEVASTTSGRNPYISYTYLKAVSCTSNTFCVAVGYGSSTGGDVGDTFAESYNGTSWKQIKSATVGRDDFDELLGISCTSSTSCVSGGYEYGPSTAFVYFPLVEAMSKGALSATSISDARRPGGYISGISCPSSKMCIAVGSFYTDETETPLVEMWNGKSWTLVVAPSTGAMYDELEAVTCTSTSFCMIVGGYGGDDAGGGPLVMTFNGSSFSSHNVPVTEADSEDAYLYAVSCASPTACLAAGQEDDPPFSVWWNGKSVSVSTMPQPQDEWAEPYGVACVSKSKCFATAEYETATPTEEYDYQSYIAVWNGHSWSFVTQKVRVAGASEVELGTITCPSSKRCVSVGWGYNSSTGWEAISDIYNGSKWTGELVGEPSHSDYSGLSGVACTSSKACIAVGVSYSESNGRYYPSMAKVSGTTWSDKSFLSDKVSGDLYAVACATSSLCFAAGESYPNLYNDEAWIMQDKSGKWSTASHG